MPSWNALSACSGRSSHSTGINSKPEPFCRWSYSMTCRALALSSATSPGLLMKMRSVVMKLARLCEMVTAPRRSGEHTRLACGVFGVSPNRVFRRDAGNLHAWTRAPLDLLASAICSRPRWLPSERDGAFRFLTNAGAEIAGAWHFLNPVQHGRLLSKIQFPLHLLAGSDPSVRRAPLRTRFRHRNPRAERRRSRGQASIRRSSAHTPRSFPGNSRL